MLNATFQSHSIKMGCCSTNEKSLIVATINPIPCRPCVHPSTFLKVLIDKFCISKHRGIIIFAPNLFFKTQTNQASHHLDCQSSIFSLPLGLGT